MRSLLLDKNLLVLLLQKKKTKKNTPKTYKCDICGITKAKSNDLKDHKMAEKSREITL